MQLLGGAGASVFLVSGDQVDLGATVQATAEAVASERPQPFPMPLSEFSRRRPMAAQVLQTGVPASAADFETDPRVPEEVRQLMRALGLRSNAIVPMLREGAVIGVIVVTRTAPRVTTDGEITLLQTCADQAVIAIENVRLFTELQASNRELTTALDKQTATSDILRVISRSQTDVQPVFDTIVTSAGRLLRGNAYTLSRIEGDQISLAAMTSIDDAGDASHRARFPMSIHSQEDHAQAVRNRAPLNSTDAHSDPRLPETQHASARLRGYRSLVVVPLVRHDEAVGALGVARPEPGGFTDDEIALLRTFADQAVIAIENARLLTELRTRTQELTRSVEQLTALGEVGRAVSSTLDVETVLTTIVSRAVELSGLDGGVVFEYDENAEEFVERAMTETSEALADARRATRIRKGEGVLGRTAITLEPVEVADITLPGAYEGRLREILLASGIRAILAVPMVREGHLVGCLGVTRNQPGDFPAETIDNALILVRERATRRGITLGRTIEEHLGTLRGDERKVKQVLLNLLSNALKFTPAPTCRTVRRRLP